MTDVDQVPAGRPFVVVLGIAQDGGRPQAGCTGPCCTGGGRHHHPACLAIVEPSTRQRWLIDATPALPAQLGLLDRVAPGAGIDGVLLTHAHMGHYTGLVHLGREAMAADRVPVHCGRRLRSLLTGHDPWRRLVEHGHVVVASDEQVEIGGSVTVTAVPVPHRDEISDTVAYRIDGPSTSVLWLPDIDSWDDWEAAGTVLEDVIDSVDVAWIDATFWDDDELARDMTAIPHPRARRTVDRLARTRPDLLPRVRLVHLNHTNPLLDPDSAESAHVSSLGVRVARELDVETL